MTYFFNFLKDLFPVIWYTLEYLDIINEVTKERGHTTAGIPETQRIKRDLCEHL